MNNTSLRALIKGVFLGAEARGGLARGMDADVTKTAGFASNPIERLNAVHVELGAIIMSAADSRRHPRRKVVTNAWLQRRADLSPFAMRTVDLAREGARFVQTRPMPEGEALQVSLQLGSRVAVIECKGRVCWTKPAQNGLHEFGVRFVDLLDEERERVDQFLGANKARPALAAV